MQFLKVVAAVILLVGLATSCTKEVAQEQVYPSEITLDNWEEFVHAPRAVIDELMEKEKMAMKGENTAMENVEHTTAKLNRGGANPGWVRLCRATTWSGLPNVTVTQGTWTQTTDQWGKYVFPNTPFAQVCMNYSTPELNGVTTWDLVFIQRHILNIDPFYNILPERVAASKYVAADANKDGHINGQDIITLRKLLLGIASLPAENMSFIAEGELVLSLVQDPAGLASLYFNCRNNASYNMNRYAIKTGDLNDTFVY